MRNETLKPGRQEHVYEIWSNDIEPIRGRVITEYTAGQCRNQYAYYYRFEGREHVYTIVSHEAFTRETALSFATALYERKVYRLQIDLAIVQP